MMMEKYCSRQKVISSSAVTVSSNEWDEMVGVCEEEKNRMIINWLVVKKGNDGVKYLLQNVSDGLDKTYQIQLSHIIFAATAHNMQ